MIANPDSGPYTLGYWDEAGYPAAEAAAEAAGIQVYGYVDSDYMIDPSDNGANGTSGDRSNTISDIEAQINTWLSYGIKNIFFDEVTDGINNGLGTDPNNSTDGQPNTFVEDYQELTAYVHANGGKTILNPGDVPAQSYMNAGDIVSIFEDDYSTYETTTFPSWVKSGGYNPDQFYNIIYNVPNATDMASVLSQAESDGIQNVYVTNLSLSNPYDANPSYLSTEANDAASNCSL
jgi:hypothetical protein